MEYMSNKVLIVDDESNIVIALEFLMEQAGYQVEVARTVDETIDSLQRFTPDVMLLDVMTPGIDGFDILHRVRHNPAWQHVAVIMVIAKGRDVEVTRGLALGANAYITKPFAARELLAAVQRWLDPAQYRQTLAEEAMMRGSRES
jgi:DNA-binding response OmpR family regulator